MTETDIVQIFDTTLRDGEQSPGATMNVEEKLVIARQLEKLGVDVIEAGFAAASGGDADAVAPGRRGRDARRSCSAWRARARPTSRRRCAASRRPSIPGIHIFIATSDLHLKRKLMMSHQEVIDAACWAVELRQATRRPRRVLRRGRLAQRPRLPGPGVRRGRSGAGRRALNVPDTTGYAVPDEFGELFRRSDRRHAGRRPRHLERPLPQRSRHGGGQLAGRRAQRRAPDRVHDQRHRRARRQHLAGRGGDGDQHAARRVRRRRRRTSSPSRSTRPAACSRRSPASRCRSTSRSSATTPSRTRPASTRTACSRTSRPTRSCDPRRSAWRATSWCSASTPAGTPSPTG